jgi:hypothetical protein
MFHVVFSIASRFRYFGSLLQGFARGLLALRNLGLIPSHLIPTLPPPLPIPLLDAPVPLVELPEEIIPPYPSGGLIAIKPIERQPPLFASPIPSYQPSLITVSSSQLHSFLPLFIIFAIISGFIVFLPVIVNFSMNVAKLSSPYTHASRYIPKSIIPKPISHFLPASLSSRFPSSRFLISLVFLVLLWTGPVRTHLSSRVIDLLMGIFFSACYCVPLHLHLVHDHTSLPGPRVERGTSVTEVYVANECHTLML